VGTRVGGCWLAARNYRNPSRTLRANENLAGLLSEDRCISFPFISLSLSLVRVVPVYRIGISSAQRASSPFRLSTRVRDRADETASRGWHDSIQGCFRILDPFRDDPSRLLAALAARDSPDSVVQMRRDRDRCGALIVNWDR